jgi:hypothetical protein
MNKAKVKIMEKIIIIFFCIVLIFSCHKEEVNPYNDEYDFLGYWYVDEYGSNAYYNFTTSDYVRYSFATMDEYGVYLSGTFMCPTDDSIVFSCEDSQLDTSFTKRYELSYEKNKVVMSNDDETKFLIKK